MAGLAPGRELTPAAAPATAPRDGFAIAGPADDAELRALLRRSCMPGAVRVAFAREPRHAAGDGLAGAVDHTLVHRAGGVLDGVGRLSVHRLYHGGAPRRIGYLAELRLDAAARGGPRLLREGYARLGEIARAEEADACFTSIARDNARARLVLEHGGRLGLPAYLPITDLVTVLLPVAARRGPPPDASGVAERDRDELTAFLDRGARAAQLAPTWDDARWHALARHGLGLADFRVVRERGRIVAAGGVWDQRAFRQVVVDGYAGALRFARPALALLARARLAPALPPPGSTVAQAMLMGATTEEPRQWAPLLRALAHAAAARGLAWLAIAREARDPDLAEIRRHVRAREYHTRLYEVRWPGAEPASRPWLDSPVRPEVALL